MKMTKITLHHIICLACLMLSSITLAKNTNSLAHETVKQQITKIHWHSLKDRDDWGYTVKTLLINGSGKKQQTIQSYDPAKSLELQWTLIEQQYETPSKARLHEYAETHQSNSSDDIPEELKGVEIINISSIKFKDENETHYLFSFTPRLPMFDQEANENFEGELFFNKTSNRIEKLHLKARESFSPKLSFNLESYEMTIEIDDIEGELHITSIETDKSGTLLFFNHFKEFHSLHFSNFNAVTPL